MNVIRRLALAAAVAGMFYGVGTVPVGAVTTPQPRTAAGAIAAITEELVASCAGCTFQITSNARTASRGLVHTSVAEAAGGGYTEIWGYDGTTWQLLNVSQNDQPYLTKLPGKLRICVNAGGYTRVRNHPSFTAKVVARLTKPKKVTADQFLLQSRAPADADGTVTSDGIGWYRIKYKGHTRWVASYVTSVIGCTAWSYFPYPDGTV